MQIDEKIVLNEFAIEYLICNTLDTSERYNLNNNSMSSIINLLAKEDAILDSNKINGEKIPELAIELKDFFNRSVTVSVENDSVFVAVIYASHVNLNYAKLISYYIQYKCLQKNIYSLDMSSLLNLVLKYKTWNPSLLKQIWYSQKINNTTLLSEDLVDYPSASGSIQFKH